MVVAVLNYGLGNLNSICRMIEKAGGQSAIIDSAKQIGDHRHLVIPGVGHFSHGMHHLRDRGLIGEIELFAQNTNNLIMGICLGMQLLCQHSEEGDVEGLGLVDANVKKFDFPNQPALKVPHMGWNTLRTARENPLLPMDEEERRFYFVHSYKVVPNNPDISIGQCDYGGEFCAAFQQGNVLGVQFHPEKSHRFGMALMKRFVEL
jgi:glutamine amidotransferase